MRKITQETCRAFEHNTAKTLGNTHTDGTTLFLHGNAIARHTDAGLEVTNAGWFSNTTKERLNGLGGVGIFQKKGEWYLNGKLWDGQWVNVPAWNEKTI